MPEKKILIVDDNADLVHIMGAHLEGHGYSVVSASDVAEALKAIQTKKPDLIILDVAMPGAASGSIRNRARAARSFSPCLSVRQRVKTKKAQLWLLRENKHLSTFKGTAIWKRQQTKEHRRYWVIVY